ncbi:MAG TPA: hypothetical protein VHS09_07420, partial [Polyangiaceae bacterium]|nr:hypothetical protein [Polyangiaceae bacterium]
MEIHAFDGTPEAGTTPGCSRLATCHHAAVVAASGNTTVPTEPEAPPSSSSYVLGARTVPCVFLAWSKYQPHRVGEVAPFDPRAAGPFVVGREDPGDPARVHFFQIRPGSTIDGGPLAGVNLSREQFAITVDGDTLCVRNTGSAHALADGTEIPKGATVRLGPGSVLEVVGNCVLLVGRSPLSLPPPPACLLPLHPFGQPDRLGLVGESARMHQ